MNELLQTYTLLAASLRADPRLCLASAVTWLDPLWQDDGNPDCLDDWGVPQDEDGTLAIALRVTRKAFPDVYMRAVEAVRRGASYAELDHLICGAITEGGIPLDNPKWIGFGIPMPAYGALLEDPDFYTAHPDVLPVLACFGVSPEPNPHLNYGSGHINVPDCVYTAGRLIAADLQRHEQQAYRQLSWLMQWLTSCSGNSSIDFSYEEICEFQPLSWEADELAFAIDIIEEADGIMADALAGLAFINWQPDVMAALWNNVRRIYKAIEKQGDTSKSLSVVMKW